MLRYLKWVFLIFGGLALIIISFFIIQNSQDIKRLVGHWDKLNYDDIKESCRIAQKAYFYPCFKRNFKEYISDAGVTGISFGVNSALSFLEKDKLHQKAYTGHETSVVYALNTLELNNFAIKSIDKKFTGMETFYSGYLASIRDYLEKAHSFSSGIIEGLKSDEGIAKLENAQKRDFYVKKLSELEVKFEQLHSKASLSNKNEIDRVLREHGKKK